MSKPSLRVLCFGDSLTAGYSAWGSSYHPYSEALESRLAAAFPDSQIRTIENGMPGDIVSAGNFLARLNTELQRPPFDWTIILGGTNDLAYGIDVKRICGALQETWDAPLKKGSKVLALTVPECAVKKESLDKRRGELNANILSYKKTNVHAFDLHAVLPYHSLSDEEREKYWDDGLHLTADGYDWMGGHIADALISIIRKEEGGPQPVETPRKSRRVALKPEESVTFDEESGDPGRINEGYVVVRKKDLE